MGRMALLHRNILYEGAIVNVKKRTTKAVTPKPTDMKKSLRKESSPERTSKTKGTATASVAAPEGPMSSLVRRPQRPAARSL